MFINFIVTLLAIEVFVLFAISIICECVLKVATLKYSPDELKKVAMMSAMNKKK